MNCFRIADEHRYYGLQKYLLAASYQDQNEYPKTLQRAYYMLHSHTLSISTTFHHRKDIRGNVNVMFKQSKRSKDQGNSQGFFLTWNRW